MDNLNNKIIILYTTIVIILIFISKKININISTAMAIIASYLIIKNTYKIPLFKEQKEKNIIEEKNNYIVPKNKTDDKIITEFLFSVQDFHRFNPEEYQNMITYINTFYSIYYNIKENNKNVHQLWDIAVKNKKDALNSFNSINLSLPSDVNVITKLDKKSLELEEILNNKLEDMYCIYLDDLYKGRNWYTKQINIGPEPYNNIESKNSSYDVY